MSLRAIEVDDRGLAERTCTGTGTARARLGHVLAAFDRAGAQAHPAALATEAPVAGSGRRHMIFLADRPGRSQWPFRPLQTPIGSNFDNSPTMTRRGVRACRGRGDTEVPAKALALDVEAELRHVTVGHHVVLALDAHPPRGAGSGHRPGGDQVVVRDDLSLDDAALDVRVDD